MRTEKKSKAFTLIELLVVISIVALLLSILMPSLTMVKKQAAAVICASHLREWGLAYNLYTNDNDGKFADPAWGNNVANSFTEVLRDYYDDLDAIRLCPLAKKKPTRPFWNAAGIPGLTFEPWYIDPVTVGWMNDEDCGLGSYGENFFIRDAKEGDTFGEEYYWHRPDVSNAKEAPMFCEAKWQNFGPYDSDVLPTRDDYSDSTAKWTYADAAMMRRHKKGINVVFLDWSVRYVECEALWDLRWNRLYQPRGLVDLWWLE